MKTCPVCGETYSERIDFCFNEGAALVLNPSAIDAPMPRASQSGAVASLSAPAPPRRAAPPPASAPGVPSPSVDSTSSPVVTRPVAEIEPSAVEETDPSLRLDAPPRRPPPPPPPQTTGRTEVPRSVEAPAGPLAGASPADSFERNGEDAPDDGLTGYPRRGSPSWWPFAVAFSVLAVLLLLWLNRGAGEPDRPSAAVAAVAAAQTTVPVRSPEPAIAATADPAVPPEASLPNDDGSAVAAPTDAPIDAPIDAAPEAVAAPVADTTPRPVSTAPPRPAPRAPASTPAAANPSAATKASANPANAAPASSGSPWDLPSAAASEASAVFSSDPPGALLRVDGVPRGTTPVEVVLPFGEHLVELELAGYRPVAKSVQVASANPKYPHILVPTYRTGNVLITAPGWEGAQLFVDGAPEGRIPTQVLLREGSHAFELRRGDQSRTTERRVRIDPSGVSRINLAE